MHHRGNGKVYALKTLAKKNIIKTDQLTHCRDEIANLRAARNPFIVNLYSTFMDDLYIYMVRPPPSLPSAEPACAPLRPAFAQRAAH